MPDILEFQGDYRWLSNFWPAQVVLANQLYPTVENAYQAAKSLDPVVRLTISRYTPGQAKRAGRNIQLRSDWDEVKLGIMYALVYQKFTKSDRDLERKLISTGTCKIIEGNRWHDNFWGQCLCPNCKGKGLNHLGNTIMKVRAKLKVI